MKELWKKRQELVECALKDALAQTPVLDPVLRESMEYSLMAGGKRLRPVLLMAAADAVEAAVDAALAEGRRTADIYIEGSGCTKVGTTEMTDAVLAHL